jgi:hypothetical protein
LSRCRGRNREAHAEHCRREHYREKEPGTEFSGQTQHDLPRFNGMLRADLPKGGAAGLGGFEVEKLHLRISRAYMAFGCIAPMGISRLTRLVALWS